MGAVKIRFPLTTFLLCVGVLTLVLTARAQDEQMKRGTKGPISKTELTKHLQAGEQIDSRVIQGADLIAFMKESDKAIHIRNSVIKGGLDFSTLPAMSLKDAEEFLINWSDAQKIAWRRKFVGKGEIPVVKNDISITETEIRSTVNAMHRTLFVAPASFDHTIFSGAAIFSGAIFGREAYFLGAIFSRKADFSWTIFSGTYGASFSKATFSGEADFRIATFSGAVSFGGATFSGAVDFGGATFSGAVDFGGATFSGVADFRSATFSGVVSFRSSGEVDFRSATFSGVVSFGGATFSGAVDFGGATFNKLASFRGTRFFDELDCTP